MQILTAAKRDIPVRKPLHESAAGGQGAAVMSGLARCEVAVDPALLGLSGA